MISQILARLGSIASDRLTVMVGRDDAGKHGVIVLHGGLRTHFLTPDQARRDALKLLDYANLAARDGSYGAGDLDPAAALGVGGYRPIAKRRRVR